jgi:hypothetical protein
LAFLTSSKPPSIAGTFQQKDWIAISQVSVSVLEMFRQDTNDLFMSPKPSGVLQST